MTREEMLNTMKGPQLIEEAFKLGVKVKCDKARTKLVEKKSDVVARILAFEAEQSTDNLVEKLKEQYEVEEVEEIEEEIEEVEEVEETEEIEEETSTEEPTAQSEELSEESKQNTKAAPKKSNLRLSDLTYNGQTKSIREWAAELDMPWTTLYDRVNRNGWSVEEALETPLGQRRKR